MVLRGYQLCVRSFEYSSYPSGPNALGILKPTACRPPMAPYYLIPRYSFDPLI